jgi:hypothetical protein
VLEESRKNKVYVNLWKCKFFKEDMVYLRLVVSSDRSCMNLSMVLVVFEEGIISNAGAMWVVDP